MQIPIWMGDVFATVNPMALGKAINAIQWFWSGDGESKYSHAGIIIDDQGTTFEALWTVTSQDIFKAYAGKNVIIARPRIPEAKIKAVLVDLIAQHRGQFYPFWRLGMHLLSPLAKVALFNRLVCSELTAKYEYLIGSRHDQYKGANPDMLADEWRTWKNYTVIHEGVL